MANPSKAQLLSDVQTLLKKRYRIEPSSTKFSVLEAVVYAICHENARMVEADQAFARFKSDFFDWNEVRVSSIEDLSAVFKGMSDEEGRAQRLRRFLRQLFDKTYGFTLDALTKKPHKDSVKVLQEYEVFQSDYMLGEVSRLALGGHAIGLDAATLRVLDRLGIGLTDGDIPALRGSIERAVPKNRGAEFAELMEELAADVCLPVEPKCAACELKKICPTGIDRLSRPPVKHVEPAPKPAKGAKAEPTEKPAAAAQAPASPPRAEKASPAKKSGKKDAEAAAPAPIPAPAPAPPPPPASKTPTKSEKPKPPRNK